MSSSNTRMMWICMAVRSGSGLGTYFLTRVPSSISTSSIHQVTDDARLPLTERSTNTGTLSRPSRQRQPVDGDVAAVAVLEVELLRPSRRLEHEPRLIDGLNVRVVHDHAVRQRGMLRIGDTTARIAHAHELRIEGTPPSARARA